MTNQTDLDKDISDLLGAIQTQVNSRLCYANIDRDSLELIRVALYQMYYRGVKDGRDLEVNKEAITQQIISEQFKDWPQLEDEE